jgi:hypothetical protein
MMSQKLYYDSTHQQSLQHHNYFDPQTFALNDFLLTDCPSSDMKQSSLDKKMLADVLGFAWQRVNRQIPSCVVLVTDDPEFSYLLTKLKEMGVQTILIHSHLTQTSDLLLDCCHRSLSYEEIFSAAFDVLDLGVSDCDSDLNLDYEDEEENELLFGEQIVHTTHLAEETSSLSEFISPSDFQIDSHSPVHVPWSLSQNDPILEECSSFSDFSSFPSPFKGFSDHSLSPPFLSGSGSYDLWQSRPSSDLFYLLHSSCFPSSG